MRKLKNIGISTKTCFKKKNLAEGDEIRCAKRETIKWGEAV